MASHPSLSIKPYSPLPTAVLNKNHPRNEAYFAKKAPGKAGAVFEDPSFMSLCQKYPKRCITNVDDAALLQAAAVCSCRVFYEWYNMERSALSRANGKPSNGGNSEFIMFPLSNSDDRWTVDTKPTGRGSGRTTSPGGLRRQLDSHKRLSIDC
jgi:hypothetical protein